MTHIISPSIHGRRPYPSTLPINCSTHTLPTTKLHVQPTSSYLKKLSEVGRLSFETVKTFQGSMIHLNIVFVQSQVATLGKGGGGRRCREEGEREGERRGEEGGREGGRRERERERERKRRREGGNEFWQELNITAALLCKKPND